MCLCPLQWKPLPAESIKTTYKNLSLLVIPTAVIWCKFHIFWHVRDFFRLKSPESGNLGIWESGKEYGKGKYPTGLNPFESTGL